MKQLSEAYHIMNNDDWRREIPALIHL